MAKKQNLSWHERLLSLCTLAKIVALNDDVTVAERLQLSKQSDAILREVIAQMNAAGE